MTGCSRIVLNFTQTFTNNCEYSKSKLIGDSFFFFEKTNDLLLKSMKISTVLFIIISSNTDFDNPNLLVIWISFLKEYNVFKLRNILVSCGVPQGFLLGTHLFNLIYY